MARRRFQEAGHHRLRHQRQRVPLHGRGEAPGQLHLQDVDRRRGIENLPLLLRACCVSGRSVCHPIDRAAGGLQSGSGCPCACTDRAFRPVCIHVNEGHFFFLLAGLGPPIAVHGQTDLRDRQTLGCITQLRIAREVPNENDFVEAGHVILRYFAASTTAGAELNSTRNTSLCSANLVRSCVTAVGPASKMMFT